MKNQSETKQESNTGLRELSNDELAAVNGGKLSPANCNALAANGFWVSYNLYCT